MVRLCSVLIVAMYVTMSDCNANMLRVVSYNSRGFNDSKKQYIRRILSECDILFLQEHWLADGQLACLTSLSADHVAVGISGFDDSDVLRGRPYGGCAIIWKSALNLRVSPIVTNSRRVCAVLFESDDFRLLCICVYMPYESDASSISEFQFQLSVIDTLLQQHPDCHVLVGGDFNVDLSRNWNNTLALNEFCASADLFPVVNNVCSRVDYTHHFSMNHFTVIDHFLASDSLYKNAVKELFMMHDVDNMSDHEPLCLMLELRVMRLKYSNVKHMPRPSWAKASDENISAYQAMLRVRLNDIVIPRDVLLCSDRMCCSSDHLDSLTTYASLITDACVSSAASTIPSTRPRGCRGNIPGWSEFVAPLRDKSIFWHNIWVDYGWPREGVVANIMRTTRARYHAAIRKVRREEADIVNSRFATAISENRQRDFWREVNQLRCQRKGVCSVIDGLTHSGDIAERFADKYKELYTSVTYDTADMQVIRDKLNKSVLVCDVESSLAVTMNDVLSAITHLKADKCDGNFELNSNHFRYACNELAMHISFLFSAMLVHGYAAGDMATCTLIPIPKGKNNSGADSVNYRGIALSSIFGKVFDLIFLNKFSDCLFTSTLQFGFKPKHSTSMCTMVLKETLAYYTVDVT